MNIDELYEKVTNFWPNSAKEYDTVYKKAVLGLVQERIKFYKELPELTNFFFEEAAPDLNMIKDNKFLKAMDDSEIKELLEATIFSLKNSDFSIDDLNHRLNKLLESTNKKPAELFSIIRITTTWANASPPLVESLAVLGKENTLSRINKLIDIISK